MIERHEDVAGYRAIANQSSLGTVVTRSGALLIGVALIMLAVGPLTGN